MQDDFWPAGSHLLRCERVIIAALGRSLLTAVKGETSCSSAQEKQDCPIRGEVNLLPERGLIKLEK